MIDSVLANDRGVVGDIYTRSGDVFRPGIFSVVELHKQSFAVRRERFMNPHIGNVTVGDIVGKPLVAAFVYNDKIEPHAPATTAEIHSHVAVFESIPVSYRTLVLHSEVRNMHQF